VWGRVDEEAKPEELEIPGVPEALDPDLLFEYDVHWTVALMREGIPVLAQAAGKPQRSSSRPPQKRPAGRSEGQKAGLKRWSGT
jgi:hypothetical protein